MAFRRSLPVIAFVVACGGNLSGSDAGKDATAADAGDASWTQCTSPNDYAVCNGSAACNPPQCSCDFSDGPNNLGLCIGAPYAPFTPFPCHPGNSDDACMRLCEGTCAWNDVPFELAELVSNNGGGSILRYADLSLWTADPLPPAPSCPTFGSVASCGGGCGACPSGEACVGRSPLHPVGICEKAPKCSLVGDPDAGIPTMPCPDYATQSCFTYLVQSTAQNDADNAGICLPKADCDALANGLPGGGKCYGGP